MIVSPQRVIVKDKSCFCAMNQGFGEVSGMVLIPDEPIIRCMEAWGYPPWLLGGENTEDREDEEIGIK